MATRSGLKTFFSLEKSQPAEKPQPPQTKVPILLVLLVCGALGLLFLLSLAMLKGYSSIHLASEIDKFRLEILLHK